MKAVGWLTVDDVAAHLQVSRDTVYRWVDKRGMPVYRVGRTLRFRMADVDRWVEQGGSPREKGSPRKRK